MTAMQVFEFESTPVSIDLDANGNPWWVASDVCASCGLADVSKAISRLDDNEKGTKIVRTPGGEQKMLTVNESGLWSLVLTSRKAQAKRFKKWLTSEVIPSIRKTGGYSTAPVDPVLESARNVVAMLERQAETDRKVAAIEVVANNALLEVRTLAASVIGVADYMALAGYCKSHRLRFTRQELSDHGKVIASRCRTLGLPIKEVPNETWGKVNAYPVDVLDWWRASLRPAMALAGR